MSWQTPVTNRTAGSRTTATDMNRIAGNLNNVLGTTLKANYTDVDVVLGADWTALITQANNIATMIGEEPATNLSTWDNLNHIEQITKTYHDMGSLYPSNSLYPSETTYPA